MASLAGRDSTASEDPSFISLHCLLRGKTSAEDVFSVRISREERIASLRERIVCAASRHLPRGADADALELWTVKRQYRGCKDNFDSFQNMAAFVMAPRQLISTHFPLKMTKKKKNGLHVLVDWPGSTTSAETTTETVPPTIARTSAVNTFPQPQKISLNCICRDWASIKGMFVVEVDSSLSVFELQRKIVRASLTKADPCLLILRKISEQHHQSVATGSFSLSALLAGEPLSSTEPISTYFSGDGDESWKQRAHVFVDWSAPSPEPERQEPTPPPDTISLNCVCRGGGKDKNMVSVTVNRQDTVMTLRTLVYDAFRWRKKKINPDTLTLWMVCSLVDATSGISLQTIPSPMIPELPVSAYFRSSIDDRSKHAAHIIVDTPVSINCACQDRMEDMFTVHVRREDTIATLQKAVLDAGGAALANMSPGNLILWRVGKKAAAEPACFSKPIKMTRDEHISTYFNPSMTKIKQSRLHVLVDCLASPVKTIAASAQVRSQVSPALPVDVQLSGPGKVYLNCILRDRVSAEEMIAVGIKRSLLILDLQQRVVQAAGSLLENIDPSLLVLRKMTKKDYSAVVVSSDLSSLRAKTVMSPSEPISIYFSGYGGKKWSERAHIFVDWQDPSGPQSASEDQSSASSSPSAAQDPVSPSQSLKLSSPLASARAADPPSSLLPTAAEASASIAQPSPYNTLTRRSTPCIPLSLLHPIFGHFIDDLQNLSPTTREYRFMDAFSDGFTRHAAHANPCGGERRVDLFTRLVQEHLGFRLQHDAQLEIRSAKAYGCLYLMLHSSSLSQNEDPFVSACDAYERYVGRSSDDLSKLPALPCLHVILYGPFISFAGSAIVSGKQQFEVLLPAIIFTDASQVYCGDALRTQAARAFGAMSNAMERFKRFYAEAPSRILHAPYPALYRLLESKVLVTLSIDDRIDEDVLVYSGWEEDSMPVCVQFVREQQPEPVSSPRAIEKLPGGWIMVITDLKLSPDAHSDADPADV